MRSPFAAASAAVSANRVVRRNAPTAIALATSRPILVGLKTGGTAFALSSDIQRRRAVNEANENSLPESIRPETLPVERADLETRLALLGATNPGLKPPKMPEG
mgnify:CR=1 FL=1